MLGTVILRNCLGMYWSFHGYMDSIMMLIHDILCIFIKKKKMWHSNSTAVSISDFFKCIILSSKDVLNQLKMTVNTITRLPKISISHKCCSFELSETKTVSPFANF